MSETSTSGQEDQDTMMSQESPTVRSKTVKKQYKLKKKRQRNLRYPWERRSEISALITAVKKRPPLWDASCTDYRLANIKSVCWQQVVDDLGIQEVDILEARNKWNVIRSLFKTNLAKSRARKSDQGTCDSTNIRWTHFSEMMFIEHGEETQSYPSTSKTILKGEYTDASSLSELDQTPISPSIQTIHVPTELRKKIPSKPRTTKSSIQVLSPTPSSTSNSVRVKNLPTEVLSSTRPQGDRLTSFGELVERNLRSLPTNESIQLEGRLMQVMYEFLGSRTDTVDADLKFEQ